MKLGAFSVSLNVKDINASRAFYENLGFKVFEVVISYLFMLILPHNVVFHLNLLIFHDRFPL